MSNATATIIGVGIAALVAITFILSVLHYNTQWQVNRCEATYSPVSSIRCLGPEKR